MPGLAEFQGAFARALLAPDECPPPDIDGNHGARQRFSIYRNNVFASLINSLAATFPATERLVGRAFFCAMAREFIQTTPPCSPVLLDYGGLFPSFIERFLPAASIPYLADVARLEWAWMSAYHAADATPLPLEAVFAVDAATMARQHLVLNPAVRVVGSSWPVVSLWSSCIGCEGGLEVDLKRAETALVLRIGLEVRVHRITCASAVLIERLAAGDRVIDAASTMLEQDTKADLTTELCALFEARLVVGLSDKPLKATP